MILLFTKAIPTGTAIDWRIGQGHSIAAITRLLDRMPETIDGVVTNGAPAMTQAVHHTHPEANYIMDRFHLVR